jgi:BirA family biotin operon repressor/biotin-[acetyl-CoA-carboxylase] ligase
LRELYSAELPHLFTVRTDYQTAGRGQAGNSWESQKGCNLLFSSLLRYDGLVAAEQWRLSMLVALATYQALAKYLPSDLLAIKWPNDIYFGDKKLVGILIENMLQGANVGYTIAGIGINVNQTQWLSNAPNPISMRQITGEQYDIEALLTAWTEAIQEWEQRTTDEIKAAYMAHLYRRQGWYLYVEREVSTLPTAIAPADISGAFEAQIVDIAEQGELLLQLRQGEQKKYHFKQLRFVL